MIEKTYTFADIPHDLTSSSGRIRVVDINAITGSKKRKRSEIAVAVDHQGVNIYDVSTLVHSMRHGWA
jgi:tRNA(Phe) wybutosine-synthesizing methylase Tyw3